ncbi:myrosinase 1-like [Schistocerca americana]|uniref:myrosinase 1-like n=1 Tax=Schistocerca americana TaxID=7009 RepID=UPI001F4F148D|nr:myrosinase 1-like [Schistocerca americana]
MSLLIALTAVLAVASAQTATNRFPDDFMFGAVTSAYQVEGAWNEDGKRESIQDYVFHNHPKYTTRDTGDVACDSYHKYQEDVQMLRALNAGIDYYNNLINELLANGIQPLVKWWITINAPAGFVNGYAVNEVAPAQPASGIGDYLAIHTVIKAHARVWHLYNEQYRASQNGIVGITFEIDGLEPLTRQRMQRLLKEHDSFRAKYWLYEVDFNSPNRTRTPKDSAGFMAEVFSSKQLPNQ